MFVDLDHFKYINDSLGHVVGDQLLKSVALRLGACLRDTDTVARLGGDDFILLLPEIGSIDAAARLATLVGKAVADQTYVIDSHELRINASIGISIYPEDGEDAVTLIKNADAAMYHAKEMGRNNFQFFTQDMNARAFAVLSLETSLRRAVEKQEFLLHYQPQLNSAGQVVGVEALVRWQHPEMGLVFPGQFIAIAEERGLIVAIGEWVLREACRQNRAWHDAGLMAVPVGVNVSALQFRQPDFPDKIAAVLRDTGLAPEFLELEITESVIMHGAENAIATLRRLKSMGVKLSIDDFGTGYSSLSYLKQFPIDRLKLDQSFVRGLPGNPDDLAISSAVLGMAKALNLKVIAEGVESEAQMNFLFSRDCDEVQGYFFTKPLPAGDVEHFISRQLLPTSA
jgi:diguanylate cyclase (GGDEF)-like protein